MKVGVVCEGMTDFFAINHYIGAALLVHGIPSEFIPLQPQPDNTSDGGWSHVFTWLDQNPPIAREQLFGRGLFANSRRLSQLDVILIQLDTDIVPEPSFLNYIATRNFQIGPVKTLKQKSAEVTRAISHFALLHECTPAYAQKHIPAPIAESSEAWCIAVDSQFTGAAESLSGQALIDAFGVALARFNKQVPRQSYANINKKQKSRERYCKGTASGVERLKSCTQFVALVETLRSAAPPIA